MNGDSWSPSTYLRFEAERTRPARDLLAQVPLTSPGRVVDVGCGPGNSTRLLAARFPEAGLLGIDSSAAMLASAREALPRAVFVNADAATWLPDPDTELVFANAVFQWIPDHLAVFQRILARLGPGAVLAVQMPDNCAEPSHQLMQQVAAEGPWAEDVKDVPRAPLPAAGVYYQALRPLVARLEVWHTIYNHVLPEPDAVVDWMRGTALRPFLDPLAPDQRAEFLRRYRALIHTTFPPLGNGEVLLRFPRLFIVAVR